MSPAGMLYFGILMLFIFSRNIKINEYEIIRSTLSIHHGHCCFTQTNPNFLDTKNITALENQINEITHGASTMATATSENECTQYDIATASKRIDHSIKTLKYHVVLLLIRVKTW